MTNNRKAAVVHWLTAGLVLVQLAIGFIFHLMEYGPVGDAWFAWHKTFGTVLLLTALVYAVLSMKRKRSRVASREAPGRGKLNIWTHRALAACLVVLPLTGWISVSAWTDEGSTTGLVGGIRIPLLPYVSKGVGDVAEEFHKLAVQLFTLVIAAHILTVVWQRLFKNRRNTANSDREAYPTISSGLKK